MPRNRRSFRARLAAVAIAGLSACSGGPDWREVTWPEGGFAVLLPGRPASESRKVRLGTEDLAMTMLRVRIDPFLYGAGYAPLPDGLDAGMRERLLEWATRGLMDNIQATVRGTTDTTLGEHPCRDVEAAGTVQSKDLAMRARVCLTGQRLHQILVIAPRERINDADSALFLKSLRFID